MALIHWFNGFDGVEQLLYGVAALSTVWFGLALATRAKKEHWFREYGEALFVAVWLALAIRATLVELYSIPSESMVPTLLVKDHLVVSKAVYGWHLPFSKGRILEFKKPKRGDIVIFVPPKDPQKSFVKRCVGIPGDQIEVRDKILYVNGQASEFWTSYGFLRDVPAANRDAAMASARSVASRPSLKKLEFRVHEWLGPQTIGKASYVFGADSGAQVIAAARLLDGAEAGVFQTFPKDYKQPDIHQGLGNKDWFGPLKLGPGEYWMMGDDRDNSADSRYFGPVPEENLRGTPLFRYWPLDRIGLVR
ncbi:MAG: signal peptidase I [candidate division FCPU426 bacterium]